MPAIMARIRITIDTEESHKRAFLSRAEIEGLSPQLLFQRFVEQYCPEDLRRARTLLGESSAASESDDDEPAASTAKRPRKK